MIFKIKFKKSALNEQIKNFRRDRANSLNLFVTGLLLGATAFFAKKSQARTPSQHPKRITVERIVINRDENLEKLIASTDKGNKRRTPYDPYNSPPSPPPISPRPLMEAPSAFEKEFRTQIARARLEQSIEISRVQFEDQQSLDRTFRTPH